MADELEALDTPKNGVLEVFVHMANESKLEIGITLMAIGGIVTGTLSGRDMWLEAVAVQHEEAGQEPAGNFGRALQEAFQIVDGRVSEDDAVPAEAADEFIYLRDAAYFVGGQLVPTNANMHWRGRIREIAGWSIGSFIPPR